MPTVAYLVNWHFTASEMQQSRDPRCSSSNADKAGISVKEALIKATHKFYTFTFQKHKAARVGVESEARKRQWKDIEHGKYGQSELCCAMAIGRWVATLQIP